jgi:endonuclease/exonuclease/phosphatase (EEP) superfamily protein YafD
VRRKIHSFARGKAQRPPMDWFVACHTMPRPARKPKIERHRGHSRIGQCDPDTLLRWQRSASVMLTALTPWTIAGACLGGFAFCLARRRRAGLRLLAASMACLLLRWKSLRDLRIQWAQRSLDVEPTSQITRVVSANVWNESRDVAATIAALMWERPDLLILQELTPRHLRHLEDAGAYERYPYRAVSVDSSYTGLGVLSRFEISNPQWLMVAGEPQLKVWVSLPGGRQVCVYAVHAPAPVPAKVHRWRAWFALMANEVTNELDRSEHPIVMAGDFNATVDHRSFRRLLRPDFCDVGTLARSGEMTWSTRWSFLPPVCRIDHILASSAARVRCYRVAKRVGSDHRPVIVDLAI